MLYCHVQGIKWLSNSYCKKLNRQISFFKEIWEKGSGLWWCRWILMERLMSKIRPISAEQNELRFLIEISCFLMAFWDACGWRTCNGLFLAVLLVFWILVVPFELKRMKRFHLFSQRNFFNKEEFVCLLNYHCGLLIRLQKLNYSKYPISGH